PQEATSLLTSQTSSVRGSSLFCLRIADSSMSYRGCVVRARLRSHITTSPSCPAPPPAPSSADLESTPPTAPDALPAAEKCRSASGSPASLSAAGRPARPRAGSSYTNLRSAEKPAPDGRAARSTACPRTHWYHRRNKRRGHPRSAERIPQPHR